MLAPTGTIAFMMDCDTTGIEPDIALIKYKKLVGEGYLKIVNQTVPAALRKLGYSPAQVEEIIAYVNERETIEGAPGLKPEHLSVFDCAFKPVNGERSIHYMGHIRMMGAVQPFLSGAISKTVNMPENATAEEIETVYLEGWKQGLKAIAIYRDGSKRSQPLSTGKKKDEGSAEDKDTIESLRRQLAAAQVEATRPHRRRLPSERTAVTHKFEIDGHEGYITVGLYPDGQPGEIFLKMAKEGSTISGLMDTLATSVSLALQYGVPLKDVVNKFAHVRFEPSGFTGNPEIPIAKSLVDYIFRWMGSRFLPSEEKGALGLIDRSAVVAEAPVAFGASALRPRADEGITAQSEAIEPVPAPVAGPRSGTVLRGRRCQGIRAAGRRTRGSVDQRVGGQERARDRRQQRRRQRQRQRQADARLLRRLARRFGRGHEGRLRRPGGRPQLRRMRLDHDPQRQLLQVPQLREHQRLQLILIAQAGKKPGRLARASAIPGWGQPRPQRRQLCA